MVPDECGRHALVRCRCRDGRHGALEEQRHRAGHTRLVIDIVPGAGTSFPTDLTNLGGTLYFSAFGEAGGRELWRSNGTETGTRMVKDIRPGSEGSSARYLANVGGTLFLVAHDGTTGAELWKSNGTALGTRRVADIVPGAGESSPRNLTAVGGTLFFVATAPSSGVDCGGATARRQGRSWSRTSTRSGPKQRTCVIATAVEASVPCRPRT